MIEGKQHGNYIHGMRYTPTYRTWQGMIQRCLNENAPNYEDYGEKGITICNEWFDFSNFLESMGVRPEGTTLDRIDPSGNYEPSNCRWADAHTQTVNRVSTHWLEFNGLRLCLVDWAKKLGMTQSCLNHRINHRGWSVEKALTTPVKKVQHA